MQNSHRVTRTNTCLYRRTVTTERFQIESRLVSCSLVLVHLSGVLIIREMSMIVCVCVCSCTVFCVWTERRPRFRLLLLSGARDCSRQRSSQALKHETCVCFLDLRNDPVAQGSWVSPGRSVWVAFGPQCGLYVTALLHATNLNPLHVKPTVALPDQSGIEALQLRRSVFLSNCIINWSWCDKQGLTSYKFVEAENIPPFIRRCVLLTRALLLKFTTPC